MTNRETFFHGELVICSTKKMPAGNLKEVKPSEIGFILADSETSGNHHVLENKTGIEVREDENGILWIKNTEPVNVFCVDKQRHDTITLEPGIWEVDKAKEWDYEKEEVRSVAD